jgi:glycine/D-amino acid oxidase-like deaminating enzyme
MDFDVIVLGAGIVGVSSALHLQDRGRRVALVDRRGPGEETSFGNAGLIESSSVVPYAFPRNLGTLLRYARNRSTDLYWDYRALPSFAGWLARFWWESSPERLMAAAHDMLPLIRQSVAEHDALIERAGLEQLSSDKGWIEAFRTPAEFSRQAAAAEVTASTYGLHVASLDAAPMEGRLRLTTGVEIARRDAKPTGIQLERAERTARPTFGLGARLDERPWLGLRPCTPDMRPVIGPAARHKGLWFAFGHNHHGLTLGPVTGRLLAEMMTGAQPFIDARPFRPERFG